MFFPTSNEERRTKNEERFFQKPAMRRTKATRSAAETKPSWFRSLAASPGSEKMSCTMRWMSTTPGVGVAVVGSAASVGVGLAGGLGVALGGSLAVAVAMAVKVRVGVRVALAVRVAEWVGVDGGTVAVGVRVRVGVGGATVQPQASKHVVCAVCTQDGSQPLAQQKASPVQTHASQVELGQPPPR